MPDATLAPVCTSSLRAAHLRQLERHEQLFVAQLQAYQQAFVAAGFQALSLDVLERAPGFEWTCEAPLFDPTSGLQLVLVASFLSSRPGPRRTVHVLRHLMRVRSPDPGAARDTAVMEFELGRFESRMTETDVRELLVEGAENTPAHLMLFFADRALGR